LVEQHAEKPHQVTARALVTSSVFPDMPDLLRFCLIFSLSVDTSLSLCLSLSLTLVVDKMAVGYTWLLLLLAILSLSALHIPY